MALSQSALQSWMKGSPADAVHPKQLQPAGGAGAAAGPKKHPLLDDGDGGEAPKEGEAEHNEVWSGEKHPDEVTPDDAEELMDWLEQNEPEIHQAVMGLAQAAQQGDDSAIQQHAQALQQAVQYLNPEYPHMDEQQKQVASERIAKHMRDKGNPEAGTPEHKQAVAIGLSEARSGQEHSGAGESGKAAKGGHMAPGGPGGGAPPGGPPGAMGSKLLGGGGMAKPGMKPGMGPPHTSFGSLKGF